MITLRLKSAVRWGDHTRTVECKALRANLVADVGLQAAVH